MACNSEVAIGVDVGATKILIGAVDREGNIITETRYATDRSSEQNALSSLHFAIDSFLREVSSNVSVKGIGVGVVGHVDAARGIWIRCMNIPLSTPQALAETLRLRHGVPVALDNDVHAATIAELAFGVGRRCSDFIYLNLGTGIALGIVCGGQLLRGVSNYAGEIGHTVVVRTDFSCRCGRMGCFESIASGGGIVERTHGMLPNYPTSTLSSLERADKLSYVTIFEAAQQKDELAELLIRDAVEAMTSAMINVVNLLNPSALVLGGGIFTDADRAGTLGSFLRARLVESLTSEPLPAVREALREIAVSALKPDAIGMQGAAILGWKAVG